MGEALITRRGGGSGGGLPLDLVKDVATFNIISNVSLQFNVDVNSLSDGVYLLRSTWRFSKNSSITLPNGVVQYGGGIASVQIPFVISNHAVTNNYDGNVSLSVDTSLLAGGIRSVSLYSSSAGRFEVYGGTNALINLDDYEFLELAVYQFDR